MKKVAVLFFWFCSWMSFAQSNLNQYQYVIVPSRFSFSSIQDDYRLNTLTKLLLEKYGFKAYLDTDALPQELLQSKCEPLYADVEKSGSFIRTKMQVVLKDCQNNVVYRSDIGSSKEKEYRVAYTQSLRGAFDSFQTLNYKYQPSADPAKAEIMTTVAPTNQIAETSTEQLYAQAIANGFQLVDATPKVVMKIYKTSDPKTYTAVKGSVQGVLIAKENQWFFERYENDQLVSEKVKIKF